MPWSQAFRDDLMRVANEGGLPWVDVSARQDVASFALLAAGRPGFAESVIGEAFVEQMDEMYAQPVDAERKGFAQLVEVLDLDLNLAFFALAFFHLAFDLDRYGRWRWHPEYGRVWYPNDVPVGWRPYWDGYWNYGPHGYFWVSNEPWGWAPYHYGRWFYHGSRWCWWPPPVRASRTWRSSRRRCPRTPASSATAARAWALRPSLGRPAAGGVKALR